LLWTAKGALQFARGVLERHRKRELETQFAHCHDFHARLLHFRHWSSSYRRCYWRYDCSLPLPLGLLTWILSQEAPPQR
jgi:hypothetical protein